MDWFLYDLDLRHEIIKTPVFLFLGSCGASINKQFELILTVLSLIFAEIVKIFCKFLYKPHAVNYPFLDLRTTL